MLSLLGVALAAVTCGDETAKISGSYSEVQIENEAYLYKYFCEESQDGLVAFVRGSNEMILCEYNEDLEDWAWITKK